ncbi:MAG: YceI family protein [Bdellovibrionales bacterium]
MTKKIAILLLIALPTTTLAAAYKFNPEKGQVSFAAKGKPALMSIKGEGKGVGGELTEKDNTISGQLQFQLATLGTGISLRDGHMRDKYLETAKYPTAELKLTDFKKPADTSKSFPFTGTLKIKEETKPVKGTATLKEDGGTTKVEAEFVVKLSDYPGIGVPNWKGVTVAEDIKVKVLAEAKKE